MSTLSKLRRLVLRDGVSLREASRRLGISRNTASKWLSEPEMREPKYWAAAGFKDTLLRWKVKPESGYGNKTAIQPGVQA